jgi:hypothetical protein
MGRFLYGSRTRMANGIHPIWQVYRARPRSISGNDPRARMHDLRQDATCLRQILRSRQKARIPSVFRLERPAILRFLQRKFERFSQDSTSRSLGRVREHTATRIAGHGRARLPGSPVDDYGRAVIRALDPFAEETAGPPGHPNLPGQFQARVPATATCRTRSAARLSSSPSFRAATCRSRSGHTPIPLMGPRQAVPVRGLFAGLDRMWFLAGPAPRPYRIC